MKILKKHISPIWFVVAAFVLVMVLSLTGVMNKLLMTGPILGRASDLSAGKVLCTTVADCPQPQCFGSFNITDKREPLGVNATDAEKTAYSLGDFWYNSQGELKTIECVDGHCQTSPFCLIEGNDIKDFLTKYPLAWVKEYPWLFIGFIALFGVIIWGAVGKQ